DRYRQNTRRDGRGLCGDPPFRIGRAAHARETYKSVHHQCWRWRARTSYSSIAGRFHDPAEEKPLGGLESRHHWRYRTQPRGALESPSADEVRITRVAVLSADPDACWDRENGLRQQPVPPRD